MAISRTVNLMQEVVVLASKKTGCECMIQPVIGTKATCYVMVRKKTEKADYGNVARLTNRFRKPFRWEQKVFDTFLRLARELPNAKN